MSFKGIKGKHNMPFGLTWIPADQAQLIVRLFSLSFPEAVPVSDISGLQKLILTPTIVAKNNWNFTSKHCEEVDVKDSLTTQCRWQISKCGAFSSLIKYRFCDFSALLQAWASLTHLTLNRQCWLSFSVSQFWCQTMWTWNISFFLNPD